MNQPCCSKCLETDMESPELDGSRVAFSKPICSNPYCECHQPSVPLSHSYTATGNAVATNPHQPSAGWREKIHAVVQSEVAGEMWYESRSDEERLQKLLANMEKQLLEVFSSELSRAEKKGAAAERIRVLKYIRANATFSEDKVMAHLNTFFLKEESVRDESRPSLASLEEGKVTE